MALTAANARIFGSDSDTVNVAPIGSTLPTTLGALDAAFVDIGWLGPDGISFTPSDNVQKFRGHQGGAVVRTAITESDTSFSFQALESTIENWSLQWNVTSTGTAGGVTTTVMTPGRLVLARAFVVDLYDRDDATIHHRFVIERGEIGAREAIKAANGEIIAYQFTVEVIAGNDFIHLTNDPAFA